LDVAFIVPMNELASGHFFLSRSENTYVIRHFLMAATLTSHHKQRSIKYFNSLKMESMVKDSSFHFVRILSKLGIEYGIGLGLAVAHPTKQ